MKAFEEYLSTRVVLKKTPNLGRARSLIRDSDKRRAYLLEILKKIPLAEENANFTLEYIYDILIGMIRSRLVSDGYHASGEHAHEAEISYMKSLGFPESDIRIMDKLRYNRNGILYYGENLSYEYVKKALEFMDLIYPKLKEKALRAVQ